MPRKALKESLEELRNEVDDALVEQTESSLREVSATLNSILDDIDQSADSSLKESISGVQNNLSEFEASHPKMTSALNQVMHLLSSLGI